MPSVCPDAPTRPHDPVPFMDSPVDPATTNRHEVDPRARRKIEEANRFIDKEYRKGWELAAS